MVPPPPKRHYSPPPYADASSAPKRADADAADATTDAPDAPGTKREFPKRKVAMILGYSGTGYQGMQRNPNAKTIESELWTALCRAELVSEENAVDPKKVGWMRACRTDKGVHALAQCVSFKMLMRNGSDVDLAARAAIVAQLNDILQNQMGLGPQMQIFSITRTASSFHAKDRADSRFYEYLLPTYVLQRVSMDDFTRAIDSTATRRDVGRRAPDESDVDEEDFVPSLEDASTTKAPPPPTPTPAVTITDEERAMMENYRASAEELEAFNAVLAQYVGSKNFHNFTIGKSGTDPSATRHIKSCEASAPFLRTHGTQSMEWVAVRVHGLSFMLHQIRKMIGLAVLAVRLQATQPAHRERLFAQLFSARCKANVPKAPALGLFLDRPTFDAYNRKFHDEPGREPLLYDAIEPALQAFKAATIHPQIFGGEFARHEFRNWLQCISDHAYDFRYLLECQQPAAGASNKAA